MHFPTLALLSLSAATLHLAAAQSADASAVAYLYPASSTEDLNTASALDAVSSAAAAASASGGLGGLVSAAGGATASALAALESSNPEGEAAQPRVITFNWSSPKGLTPELTSCMQFPPSRLRSSRPASPASARSSRPPPPTPSSPPSSAQSESAFSYGHLSCIRHTDFSVHHLRQPNRGLALVSGRGPRDRHARLVVLRHVPGQRGRPQRGRGRPRRCRCGCDAGLNGPD